MITLYMVTLAKLEKPSDLHFLTICKHRKDCENYINKKLLLENSSHFVAWCNLRGIEPTFSNWPQYANTTDLDTHKYVIRKMKYTTSDIASILRLYNGCVPLGCGYESPEEYTLFIKSLPKDKQEELEKFLEPNKEQLEKSKEKEKVV